MIILVRNKQLHEDTWFENNFITPFLLPPFCGGWGGVLAMRCAPCGVP